MKRTTLAMRMKRVLEELREKLPQAVDAVVARKVAEVRAPLEAQRDEAKKECDSAVDDLADLEERLFGAEKRLQEAEAVAFSAAAAGCCADEDVVQALVQERDLLKDRVRELDAEPAKWEERPRFPGRAAARRVGGERHAPGGGRECLDGARRAAGRAAPRRRGGGCGQRLRGPARGPSIEARGRPSGSDQGAGGIQSRLFCGA